MKKTVLVVFGNDLPRKKKEWWKSHTSVIAPEALRASIELKGLEHFSIESLIESGNVQEAEKMVRRLSLLTTRKGERISQIGTISGYSLWWIHYDELYYRFCLPFTQYKNLLTHLKKFDLVNVYKSPVPKLFEYYLTANKVEYNSLKNSSHTLLPFGLVVQVIISVISFFILLILRPKLMVWTSDLFDPPRDHDFRMRFIYEELYRRKSRFVEFMRSSESWRNVLSHALQRKRPVIYSHAIAAVIKTTVALFYKKDKKMIQSLRKDNAHGILEEDFLFLLSTHYLQNVTGDRISIRILQKLLRSISVQSAIVPTGVSRTFYELLACKLSSIPMVGILHGVSSKDYNVYDFMPEFDGEKSLSLNYYGVWSEWWKRYYLQHGKVYTAEQLIVSGPMRPLQLDMPPIFTPRGKDSKIKVLFIAEQLGIATEAVEHLLALLSSEEVSVYIKFRSYRDGFETWLKSQRPDVFSKIDPEKILRGSMNDAVAQCDVVVGSHSTAVLESLLQYKPPIFYYDSKWGDYFDLNSFDSPYVFIARSPNEFLKLVVCSRDIPQETLQILRERFFGDPYKNGSKWVVDTAEGFLLTYK